MIRVFRFKMLHLFTIFFMLSISSEDKQVIEIVSDAIGSNTDANKCQDETDLRGDYALEQNFEGDMTHCGKKCAAKASKKGFKRCFQSCFRRKTNFSRSCSECFTDLAHCTKKHCWSQCMKGSKNKKCGTCVTSKCRSKFERCSGLEPPTERLMKIHSRRIQF